MPHSRGKRSCRAVSRTWTREDGTKLKRLQKLHAELTAVQDKQGLGADKKALTKCLVDDVKIHYHRGFATYCIARIAPTRLLPRPPTQDETNRLSDVSNLAGAFRNRTLPSVEIPVTNCQNDLTVVYKVTVSEGKVDL